MNPGPEAPRRVERFQLWRAWLSRLLPWVSLVTSVMGAVWMDRSESKGSIVALGSAASWVGLVLVFLAHKPRPEGAESTGSMRKLLRFTSTAASQSLVQLSLFFSAPFYVEACVWTPLEALFAVPFVVAVLISLWDPLCARVLLHPFFGSLLLAFASFVAWNAALPMLGVPHRIGVWLAAGAVAVAIPAVNVASGALGKQRVGALIAGLSVPLLLLLGGVRALPPAPLRVVDAGMGTRVENRELVERRDRFAESPGALVCWTAIRAPFGLADKLLHVWRHEGEITAEIALDLRGGRKAGFRTWSRLALPKRARGVYTCEVMTSLGQTLGGAEVRIGGAHGSK